MTCTICAAPFELRDDEASLCRSLGVAEPAQCPDCRFRLRSLWRNERSLYNRACDLCHAGIVSMYNPKSPYTVYCAACWESDKWDAGSYAMEYDPHRTFFEQFRDLMIRVPKKTLYITTGLGPNVNSDYTNMAGGNKNCYLVFNSGKCEDCLYSRGLMESRDTLDGYYGIQTERCWETINAQESTGVLYGQNIVGCLDSAFLLNCSGVTNCFGCVNLRNKSYYFFNEPLEKEEYKRRIGEIMGSWEKMEAMKQRFEEFAKGFPRRENNNIKSFDSLGDYLFEAKNLYRCFESSKSENCRYMFSTKLTKDSQDCMGYSYNSELLFNCVAVGTASRVIASYGCENTQDIAYCANMRQAQNCLGCDGIKSGSFAILNKRYEKDEYEKLKRGIVAQLQADGGYGRFFPAAIAPFAYNEGIGQDNMPLDKQSAEQFGFRWENDIQSTRGKETIKHEALPDRIADVTDEIIKEILACSQCGRNYRITPAELGFYRRHAVPIPRHCFNCRFLDRIRRRGPLSFDKRACSRCNKDIWTNLAPAAAPIVYCEACYQSEIV